MSNTVVQTPKAFGHADGGNPNYEKNLGRAKSDQTDCCSFCGKAAGFPVKFWGYHEYGSDYDVAPEAPNETGEKGHIGFYPLGSDCARKLKKTVPVYGPNFKRL